MNHTSLTPPTIQDTPDLSHLVEEALDAFWDVVTDHYPLVETGDLSPETTVAFSLLAEKAVKECVMYNAPQPA